MLSASPSDSSSDVSKLNFAGAAYWDRNHGDVIRLQPLEHFFCEVAFEGIKD